MSYKTFVKMDGIKGESTAPGHIAEIEAYSTQWGGPDRSITGTSGPANGSKIKNVSIVKDVDSTSPTLFQYCAVGTRIANVVVTTEKESGGGMVPLVKYEMKGVYVTSVRPGGSRQDGNPLEEVTLDFGEMTITYLQPQTP